jgi:hypothetical protein
MDMNSVGLASAAATFLGVWIGHVSVRKIEREVERLWIPTTLALILGTALELISLWTSIRPLSTFCAILGVTLLWDALELQRQEKRIKTGHAPANPKNPRHARILSAYPSATTIDWLDRDPRGEPISVEELNLLRERT